MLTDNALTHCVMSNVTGYDRSNIGKSSLDVRLDNKFWHIAPPSKDNVIDLKSFTRADLACSLVELGEDAKLLYPGEYVRARIMEHVEMPDNLAAMFSLRSICAQVGLEQSTSVWLHPGWKGKLILELSNVGTCTLRLTPGMTIGQLHFFPCQS